jgi:hypothetical protein
MELARECLTTYIDAAHETNLKHILSPEEEAAAARQGLWNGCRQAVKTKLRFALARVTRHMSHVARHTSRHNRWSLLGLRYNWTERCYSPEAATPIPDVVEQLCR